MSKDRTPPSFPEWLATKIEESFDSDSDFARKTGVSPSVVSRWIKGTLRPTPDTIPRIAPALGVNATTLTAMIYPALASEVPAEPPRDLHPLARDLDRLLGSGSVVPEDQRAALAALVEHTLSPYRRYLRKRRTG